VSSSRIRRTREYGLSVEEWLCSLNIPASEITFEITLRRVCYNVAVSLVVSGTLRPEDQPNTTVTRDDVEALEEQAA
jgi:hypothetical protein